jgi:RNA polymerase sigma-70 factor (ECF subfamily)
MTTIVARSDRVDRPDAADVMAAAGGDLAAFERLVRSMQAHVWRYVLHLVGDPGLAEDVTQEVLWRVHRKLGTLRDPELFVPWLLSMARNAAYDAGRVRRRRPVHLVEDGALVESRTVADPHVAVEMRDARARLDSDLREAVVLVGMIGFTYDEAAETIGVPAGTVKSRVFRARRMLVEMLDHVV